MAAKSLYLLDTLAGTSQFLAVQEDGTAPADAWHAVDTGWTGGTSAPLYASLDSRTKRANADWGSTALPGTAPNNALGDGWRSPPYSGTFAATQWTFSLAMRAGFVQAVTQWNGRGRLRWRLFRSANQDGSSATEVASGALLTATTTANISDTSNTVLSANWTPGAAFSLSGEYLFVCIAFEITTAAGNTTREFSLRLNPSSVVTTSDFTPAAGAAGPNESLGMLRAA